MTSTRTLSLADLRKMAQASYIAKVGDAPVEAIETCQNKGVSHAVPTETAPAPNVGASKQYKKRRKRKGGVYDIGNNN